MAAVTVRKSNGKFATLSIAIHLGLLVGIAGTWSSNGGLFKVI